MSGMTLEERLAQDMKAAIIARDVERLGALRLLKSAAGYAAIEKRVNALSDADFIGVVQKEVKKRRDAAEQFEKGGRADLAGKELSEIHVLEAYLPRPLTAEELEEMVRTAITETGATSRKQMGPVIKAVQARAAGRADGSTISALVSRLLP
jgi:uncharacterized protein YqeY